ncbi:ATP-binding protein [Leptospira kanakyensis]|uniref:ATP-binding protein n=1 Tax=Leptospira kanakyensis TaxID=2484968 RepID=UPI00223DACE0|nr:oxidoreductase [Leptospira kanakyensis]MCW7468510.1 oxidoreductase [Leptospira kanakyensis]
MLAHNGKKVLAPVNGVASLTSDQKYFQIKQDGSWSTSSPFQSKKYDLPSLLEAFDTGALNSLDLIETPLKDYFQKFNKDSAFKIVLSPFCRYQHLNFEEMILRDMKDAYLSFIEQLRLNFPKAEISNFFEDQNLDFEHPNGIPEYFLHKQFHTPVDKTRKSLIGYEVLFLGAETIFHILRKLYYNEPFTKRHLAVFLVDRKGRMDLEPRQFFLTNGQSLAFIPTNLDKRYKIASFETVFEEVKPMDVGSLGYFNIYEHYSITLYEKLPATRKEFSCIDCMECNNYCPTHANPVQLIKGRVGEFEKNLCVSCGICTVYCPSGIDIRKRIEGVMV